MFCFSYPIPAIEKENLSQKTKVRGCLVEASVSFYAEKNKTADEMEAGPSRSSHHFSVTS